MIADRPVLKVVSAAKQTVQTAIVKQAERPSVGRSLLGFVRRHPVASYFVLAYTSWLWQVPVMATFHVPLAVGPWLVLMPVFAPITAAFVMAWVTEGPSGMVQLLRRIFRWRVGLRWYGVVLLTFPVLYLAGVIALPGGLAALRLPGSSFVWAVLGSLAFSFFGAGLVEEPGWRGYALPRLQKLHGPLAGTLILGVLWAFWHLPLFLFLPGHTGARPGFFGTVIPFVIWAVLALAFAVLITLVVNNSRGSVLLAMLFHASHNMTYAIMPSAFFPSLYPPHVAAQAPWPLETELLVILAAVVVIVVTRGRLGYDHYRRQVEPPDVP